MVLKSVDVDTATFFVVSPSGIIESAAIVVFGCSVVIPSVVVSIDDSVVDDVVLGFGVLGFDVDCSLLWL